MPETLELLPRILAPKKVNVKGAPTVNGFGEKWMCVLPAFKSLVPSLHLSDLPIDII